MYRIFEFAVYDFINLIPSLVLAVVPFRDNLRCSKKIMAVLVLFIYVLHVISMALSVENLTVATINSVVWIIIYLLFYWLCCRADTFKMLFVLLIILNYGSFVAVVVYHIAEAAYSYRSALVTFIMLLFTFPILFLMMEKKVRPLVNNPENNKVWRTIWLIPATSCLSYYYSVFAAGGVIIFSKKLSNVLFAVALNVGSLFVTYIVVSLVEQSNTYLRLKTENYQLNMQFVQYESLKNRIEEARRARHDLRQTLTVIQSYLQHGDKDGLQQFLGKYMESLPVDTTITYCEIYAVNAALVYYANIAQEKNIRFKAQICWPKEAGIADNDAVIILGNLLENAIEACARQTDGERFVSVIVAMVNDALVITVDNSYNGTINKYGKVFLSSKEEREGIGISSVQKIAQKYGGNARFENDSSIFHASILLYPLDSMFVTPGDFVDHAENLKNMGIIELNRIN